jgi:hypothetical protein
MPLIHAGGFVRLMPQKLRRPAPVFAAGAVSCSAIAGSGNTATHEV